MPVTASPEATPGTEVRSCDSGVNRGRPSRSLRSATSIVSGRSFRDALRNALASNRSSDRTPASRV